MEKLNVGKLIRKFLVGIIFAALVVTAIVVLSDVNQLIQTIRRVNLISVISAIFFAIGVYIGRFSKWNFFLKVLNVHIPLKDNIRIFFAGLSMGITPGKVGEVLKAYILKRMYAVDFSLTAPTIISERLTGVLGCFCLCVVSLLFLGQDSIYSYYIIFSVIGIVTMTVMFFRCHRLVEICFTQMNKVPILKRYIDIIKNFYQSTVDLMGIKVLLIGVIISIFYWSMECMIFYSLLVGFGVDMQWQLSVLILTTASIGGGLSLMPGSVGALEGGLIGLLVYQGVDFTVASGITLLHRFFAMWDVVIVGAVILLKYFKRFKLTDS